MSESVNLSMLSDGFSLSRYVRDSETGQYILDGSVRSLESDFGHIRYKSMSGINTVGKVKSIYTESYPESDSVRVFVSDVVTHDTTSLTLSVVCFGVSPDNISSGDAVLSMTEQVLKAEESWRSLCDFLEGGLILYTDNIRQRKLLCYSESEKKPSEDIVKGVPRITCSIELSNVFGRTFGKDDTTIEDWLASGGKEAGL